MGKISKSKDYRNMIDTLVEMCREGQGQISAQRFMDGVWNINVTTDVLAAQDDDDDLPPEIRAEYRKMLADDLEVNQLLERISADDRKIIARLLAKEVECGVFETLKILEEYRISPFETGYEGSRFNDFIGRIEGWEWPES